MGYENWVELWDEAVSDRVERQDEIGGSDQHVFFVSFSLQIFFNISAATHLTKYCENITHRQSQK
jgi:sulfur relay (sulfurtransferase) DsrC/TusE family protein